MSGPLWPSEVGALPPGSAKPPEATPPPDSTMPTEQASPTDQASPPRHGSGQASMRRRWLTVGAVVGALLLAATLVRAAVGPSSSTLPFDPDNPGFTGSQALARVLQAHGVDVVVARGEAQLERVLIDGDTTVVVSATSDLREPTIASLADLAEPAERLVLVRPDRRVVRQLAPEVSMRDSYRQDLVSSCDTDDVRPGETLSRSQAEYLLQGADASCFDYEGYAVHLQVPARDSTGPLVLVGSTDLVTNERIEQADNAAIALRTLGHSDRLVWYVPDLRDSPVTDQESAEQFFPDWLGPMVLLTGFVLLAVFFWRGRRLGRLVPEPLPVLIRAVETTESRGRLYRKARDTDRAAAVLRDATRRRLTAYLGLPAGTGEPATAAALADATGRALVQVREVLFGVPPRNDTELLALALQLSDLEEEIHRP